MPHEEILEDGASWVEARIEEFVGQVGERLQEFPAERREATAHELSEHLRAMVSARRACGLGKAQAWVESVEAFGSADEVGQALEAEWKRTPRIEVRGEPLSAGEKRRVWARPVLRVAVAYPLMLLALPWLSGTSVGHIVLSVVMLGCVAFTLWKMRQRMGRTPATLFGQAASVLLMVYVAVSLKWPGLLDHGPLSRVAHAWPTLMACALLLSVWWHRRESNTTRPWKFLPRYGKSPVAAEEEYRLGTPIGLAIGTVMSCIGTLWMGWNFFGMGVALTTCTGLIVGAVVAARLLK